MTPMALAKAGLGGVREKITMTTAEISNRVGDFIRKGEDVAGLLVVARLRYGVMPDREKLSDVGKVCCNWVVEYFKAIKGGCLTVSQCRATFRFCGTTGCCCSAGAFNALYVWIVRIDPGAAVFEWRKVGMDFTNLVVTLAKQS